MNLDERIDEMLAAYKRFITRDDYDETSTAYPEVVVSHAIKQLIDEALQAELISLINDGEKKVYERIFDRIKELQND